MLTNVPFQGEILDENRLWTQQWRLFFQALYDKTFDWDGALIEQQFNSSRIAIAELLKAMPDDLSNATITSEIDKTLQDFSLQLAVSISAGVETGKALLDLGLQLEVSTIAGVELQKQFDDLQRQVNVILAVNIGNVVSDLEIRLESIPDLSAAVAEIKKSSITKANKLSDFALTTSAEFATVITDATGTGKVVFNISPTLITPVLGVATGTQLILSGAATVGTGFGCNGQPARSSFPVGAAAIDLPTVIALANNLRTTLINNGIAV